MFAKLLIANRGEVAVRVIRACKEMGIETVAVYSEADAESLPVSMADESFCIGGPQVSGSYLNMDAILTLALAVGADAIHPGYGMLAENAEFARRCEKNGIILVGPSAEVIESMGQKETARAIAKKAGLPVTAGSEILADAEEAASAATELGYPVMLKARLGGGGKGIRVVRAPEEMPSAWEAVCLEAKSAFGDDGIYMEHYLEGVRHVEVQILADRNGKVLVLGDRDCSVQRRNQKLIEECPAPEISDGLRRNLWSAAEELAKAVGYVTAGTVEFLVKGEEYWFLEMNTRLQVEHSVTEMATGIDIVEWQIRTAAGAALPYTQDMVRAGRHAIECRICAESGKNFLPASGTVTMLHVPGGADVRFDTAVYAGCTVTPFYDSMLGKLIVGADSREAAIRKMKCALSELVLAGVSNNREMHMKFMEDTTFVRGRYDTGIAEEVLQRQ